MSIYCTCGHAEKSHTLVNRLCSHCVRKCRGFTPKGGLREPAQPLREIDWDKSVQRLPQRERDRILRRMTTERKRA